MVANFVWEFLSSMRFIYYSFKNNASKNPYMAIRFINTTDLPLENGPLMVFENNVPAGES